MWSSREMTLRSKDIPVIGFLGLGALGAPIAQRLAGVGSIVVFDPAPARLLGFQAGIERLDSPKDVADRADIVFACLVEERHHRDALLGSDGLRHGRRCKHYVHLGTSGSPFIEELDRRLSAEGITTVDAPVTGGPSKARTGDLTTIVSGIAESVEFVREAMSRYSNKIVVAGDKPGRAQTLKLVNNAIALTNLVAACEAMVIGAKAGIAADMMLDVINSGSGQNSATLDKLPHQILTRSFNFGATLAVVIKDLELFLAEPAARATTLTDTCRNTLQAFRRARDEGVEIDDLTAVVRPMERRAGVELGR